MWRLLRPGHWSRILSDWLKGLPAWVVLAIAAFLVLLGFLSSI